MVQGDRQDPRRAAVSRHQGEAASSRRDKEASNHQDGELSSLLGAGASHPDKDPSPAEVVLLVPSQAVEGLWGPMAPVAVVPNHQVVEDPNLQVEEDPTLQVVVVPIHQVEEGPNHQVVVAPTHQAAGPSLLEAEGPTPPAGEAPSQVDPCRMEVRLPLAVQWGVGSVLAPSPQNQQLGIKVASWLN